VERQVAPAVARLAQVFDPRLKIGDRRFVLPAIGAFGSWLAGGDDVGVDEDGHGLVTTRTGRGSLVGFGDRGKCSAGHQGGRERGTVMVSARLTGSEVAPPSFGPADALP
jgi:hypothetical protein